MGKMVPSPSTTITWAQNLRRISGIKDVDEWEDPNEIKQEQEEIDYPSGLNCINPHDDAAESGVTPLLAAAGPPRLNTNASFRAIAMPVFDDQGESFVGHKRKLQVEK